MGAECQRHSLAHERWGGAVALGEAQPKASRANPEEERRSLPPDPICLQFWALSAHAFPEWNARQRYHIPPRRRA